MYFAVSRIFHRNTLQPSHGRHDEHRRRYSGFRTGADPAPAGPRLHCAFSRSGRRPATSTAARCYSVPAKRRMPVLSSRKDRSASSPQTHAVEVTAGAGMLLGELALLKETLRPVTATAAEPATVIRISRSLFLKMLEGFPDAAERLRASMSGAPTRRRAKCNVLSGLDPTGRLALILGVDQHVLLRCHAARQLMWRPIVARSAVYSATRHKSPRRDNFVHSHAESQRRRPACRRSCKTVKIRRRSGRREVFLANAINSPSTRRKTPGPRVQSWKNRDLSCPEKVKIPLQRPPRKHILPAGIHSPKECPFRTGARMHKIALTAVASAAILCSGALLSDRAEAMTLGGTAAGVRVALQDVSSITDVRYRRRYGYKRYGWRRHGYGGGYVRGTGSLVLGRPARTLLRAGRSGGALRQVVLA